jgi:hypothetical protein
MVGNQQYDALLIKRSGSTVFVIARYGHREIWVRFSSKSEAVAWIVKQAAKQA